MPLVENVKRCMKEHGEQSAEIEKLRAVFNAAVDIVGLMDDASKQDSGASQAFRRLEAAILKVHY